MTTTTHVVTVYQCGNVLTIAVTAEGSSERLD